MKLSKLYSDQSLLFKTIEFTPGLNVVMAEIRVPENKQKDTHNLGKSTLGRLIDFCLLSKRNKNFFLFKHEDRFEDFTFFLELELLDGSFLTIRRSVKNATKISFKKHTEQFQDFSDLPDNQWDHLNVAFDNARNILDGLLNLQDLSPWTYRNFLGYLLRTQEDYRDVFQLKKFAGKHSDWKPLLAHLLGFDAETVKKHYDKEAELEAKEAKKNTLKAELGSSPTSIDQIEGILLLKEQELEEGSKFLDEFNFKKQDNEATNLLVGNLDSKISQLNNDRYRLRANKDKISNSLKDSEILFNPTEASALFKEAGALFEGQLKQDFEKLIAFNKAITKERQQYLREELAEITEAINELTKQIDNLNEERSANLKFLTDTDSITKYKQISKNLVTLQADIEVLTRQRDAVHRIEQLDEEIDELRTEEKDLASAIKSDLKKQNADRKGTYSNIRLNFNAIINDVISRKALLNVVQNSHNHLEFTTNILDETGRETSAGLGNTYKKLLCIAYDMATIRSHLDRKFPRFMFHDGVFESLDDRKKINLISEIRKYNDLGIQHIITLIDSELPASTEDTPTLFEESEVILTLHDEDESGRLFMMQSW